MSKDKKKLRIMVNTNGPWSPSGYAQQARQFLPKMAEDGYPTSCIAFYGLEGGIINLDDVWFYPRISSQWGDDAMISHGKHFNADVIFTLQDIWTLNPDTLKKLAATGKRWIPIVPIDHEPVPQPILERLKLAYRVVTYAPFGFRELKRNGMHSTYIPHTVQTEMFKPMDKTEIRKKAKLPTDKFIFGMVAANKDNPPRKNFDIVLQAFKRFYDKHPDSILYLHTMPDQQGGFPIKQYASHLGIPKEAIYFSDPYEMLYLIGPEDVAKIYNTFDVLLAPSQNEGFGVPIIEAQSCGVPVITTDYTAMRDLIENGKNGYKLSASSTRFTPLGSNVAIPSVEELYEKMEQIYTDDRVAMGEYGRKFVQENFDLDVVWKKHWVPFLEKLEKEIHKEEN